MLMHWHTAVAEHCACWLAAPLWSSSAGAAVSHCRELAPSGIRPCLVLQTYCLIGKKQQQQSFSFFLCTSVATPYLDLHFSQQILANFSSVHMSGVELKNMGQQILGSYPVHFHMAADVDERGGYQRPTYLDNLAIHHCFSRCVAIHGTHGLLVGNLFY